MCAVRVCHVRILTVTPSTIRRQHLVAAVPEQAHPAYCTLCAITKRTVNPVTASAQGLGPWDLCPPLRSSGDGTLPLLQEEMEEMLFHFFYDCPWLWIPCHPLQSLWCSGYGLLWDYNFLCPVPSSWGEHDLPGQFSAGSGQNSDPEEVQELAHGGQLWQCPPPVSTPGLGTSLLLS